jgi:hypothetical protein
MWAGIPMWPRLHSNPQTGQGDFFVVFILVCAPVGIISFGSLGVKYWNGHCPFFARSLPVC